MSDAAGLADLKALRAEVAALNRKLDQLTRIIRTSPGVRAIPVDEHTMIVRLLDGGRVFVDSRDLSITPTLLMAGQWEPHHAKVMRDLIRPGQLCLDIGANFGVFSILMSGLVKRGGEVHAFEPNPRVFDLLSRGLIANGFRRAGIATPHRVALSDRSGTATFNVPPREMGGGSLLHVWSEGEHEVIDTFDVEMRTLDSFEFDCNRPVFMKIDCEGSEYGVLRGAAQTIARAPDLTIMLEFMPHLIEMGMPVAEFAAYVADLGLKAYRLGDDERFRPLDRAELAEVPDGYVFLSRRALE